MSIRELIKNKKYKIELFIGRNGNKKIMHYEIVNGGKKEAELRESELKIEIRNNTFIQKNNKTINDLMNEYLDYNKDRWTAKTYYANVNWINNINKSIGHIKLKDLNVKILERFYSNLKGLKKEIMDKETKEKKIVQKYADKTIQHHYGLINGALNKAIQWGYLNYNINQKIEKPKVRKKEIECYNKEDITKILEVLDNEPLKYQAVILLAIDSGIRRGELTGLTWEDIDFKNNSININKITQYMKALAIYEKKTKTQSSDRIIFVSNTTMELLKKYKAEQMKKQIKLGCKWGNSKRVFTTEYGYDMHPNTPSKILNIIIKKYNLKRITFHGLRHTSASLLISEGVQHQIISRRLGHSSVNTTDSIYSHFFDEEFKKCASDMENILKEAN